MNILFLTDTLDFTSGVTSHLLNLTHGLGRGKNIHLYLLCGSANAIEKFKDEKIIVTVNKHFLHKKRGYINYPKALLYLSNFVKRYKIDIIHSHTYYAGKLAGRAAKHRKIDTLQTFHSIPAGKIKPEKVRSGNVIAVDEHIYDFLKKNNIAPEENIHLIRRGTEVPAVMPKKVLMRMKVLAASKFTQEKGLDLFIKAVSLLPRDDKEKAEFLIAGEGEDENKLKKLNEKLETGIRFLGRVDGMASLLRGTHIFVYPAHPAGGGFPSAIAEAAAYNNLIVTCDSDSIKPLFQSDIDGLVFKSGDDYDLMIRIKMAIDRYRVFKPMAEHFYCKVKELFGLNEMIKKHVDLYNRCLVNQ